MRAACPKRAVFGNSSRVGQKMQEEAQGSKVRVQAG